MNDVETVEVEVTAESVLVTGDSVESPSTVELLEGGGDSVELSTDPDTDVIELADSLEVDSTAVTEVVEVGPAGARGVPGGSHVHTQGVPSAVWTITHGLGFEPAGLLVSDTSGAFIDGEVTFVSTTQLVVAFSAAFAGQAFVS